MTRPGLFPPSCPLHHQPQHGFRRRQTAILRMILALPDWVRERTTLYCQSADMPLLEAAVQKHGFSVGAITTEAAGRSFLLDTQLWQSARICPRVRHR